MKIQLINVAEYDFKEEKATDIPFSTFVNLCGASDAPRANSDAPRARLFKSIDEFKSLSQSERDEFNQEENVKVLKTGQFLVFQKPLCMTGKSEKKENGTADTKEN